MALLWRLEDRHGRNACAGFCCVGAVGMTHHIRRARFTWLCAGLDCVGEGYDADDAFGAWWAAVRAKWVSA